MITRTTNRITGAGGSLLPPLVTLAIALLVWEAYVRVVLNGRGLVGPLALTFLGPSPHLVCARHHGKEMALIPATIRSHWGPNPVRPSERSHIHRG